MKNSAKIIMGLVILALAAVAVVLMVKTRNASPEPGQTTMTSPATVFAWRYQNGGEGPDGLPKTVVFLDALYENGKTVSVKIDEVQGSCNDVDAANGDADKVAGTTKIQCYAAGFGQWYKIIKADDSYQVRRKYFEEGNPEEAPIDHPWEIVAEISLAK